MMLARVRQRLPEEMKVKLRRLRAGLLSMGLASQGDFQQSEGDAEAAGNVSVIIATSNGPYDVIRRCLASLEKYASHAEIILADDCSSYQISDMLKDFQARNCWELIRHDYPVGHSRATELGASIATRPILCLLNSDTVVTPWSWRGIVDGFGMDPRIAVAGPSTSWAATSQMMKMAMHCRHYWNDSQINGYAQRLLKAARARHPIDLPEVSGCALFIRRQIWEEVGGFDPNLPDYGNDSELCVRILQRGWRIVWIRGSYIHHLGGQSYGSLDEEELCMKFTAARQYIESKHSGTKSV
jgi:GT2 family glycosyltransferase